MPYYSVDDYERIYGRRYANSPAAPLPGTVLVIDGWRYQVANSEQTITRQTEAEPWDLSNFKATRPGRLEVTLQLSLIRLDEVPAAAPQDKKPEEKAPTYPLANGRFRRLDLE